jgi:NACHT domain
MLSVGAAAFDSDVNSKEPKCLPDTRTNLLGEINEWAQGPESKCIFWLKGMAGTGKSTISRTVAKYFAKRNQLGASFFFRRGEADRDHGSKFFTTITFHLMRMMPELAPYVSNAIQEEPEISVKSLEQQFKKLIFEPLSKRETKAVSDEISTLVIVIDALDECGDDRHLKIILHLLPQLRNFQSVRIRIFITSRPELPIRLGFKDMSTDAHKDVTLENATKYSIELDISVYLKHELKEIRDYYERRFPDSCFPLRPDWPGDEKIQKLTAMAQPLFIFAATVCRFVRNPKWNPEQRLAIVLEDTATPASSLDRTTLDNLYLSVLRQVRDGCTESDAAIVCEQFREIVGPIVILADPLPTTALAKLLRIPKETVDLRLDDLHSVLSIPSEKEPDLPVRLLHLSFTEFLLDPKKRGETESWFWIDETKTHERMAIKCVELMSHGDGLRENICELEFPGKLRDEIDKNTLHERLRPDIQYGCQFWVHHLEHSGRRIHDQDKFHVFLQQHFLHWLEALSLIGRMSQSIISISTLQKLVAVSSSLLCCSSCANVAR